MPVAYSLEAIRNVQTVDNGDGTFSLGVSLPTDRAALTVNPVTIAAAASLSDAADLDGRGVLFLEMPAAWTAAALTFQASSDGVTYQNVYDQSGQELTVQAAAARTITLDTSTLPSVGYLKVRSGTSAAPVVQAADRIVRIVGRVL